MIAPAPQIHNLYISPMECRPGFIHTPMAVPPTPTSIDIAVRAQLKSKGRMTLSQIVESIGDRTSTGETSYRSGAVEALRRLVDIGAVDVHGRGANARYSTMFGPNRDYDPEARDKAIEAATSRRCAEMLSAEKVRDQKGVAR